MNGGFVGGWVGIPTGCFRVTTRSEVQFELWLLCVNAKKGRYSQTEMNRLKLKSLSEIYDPTESTDNREIPIKKPMSRTRCEHNNGTAGHIFVFIFYRHIVWNMSQRKKKKKMHKFIVCSRTIGNIFQCRVQFPFGITLFVIRTSEMDFRNRIFWFSETIATLVKSLTYFGEITFTDTIILSKCFFF